MRYKVKVDAIADFREVKEAAAAHTDIYVISERRRTLSTGDLSDRAKAKLESLGASVSPEMRYDADRSAA